MLLDHNGSLSEAALLLETAIQKGDLGEGGYEAWVLLGETRNMDEREDAGMRALAEGVRKAEIAGTPGPGMLVSPLSEVLPLSLSLIWKGSPWRFHTRTSTMKELPTLCFYGG